MNGTFVALLRLAGTKKNIANGNKFLPSHVSYSSFPLVRKSAVKL
ncbi:hypothetical protein B4135_0366 [Caldibacillus debilis]|jgi:hypothetical protein|uniref:Uncharacterized protein n=1 Tax=Caldibacillus debilis TaxID=301148 RepID=A0A150LKA2_9BACI|nr:hypothetical protein B4135_0366 [Caldibacillus debilis]